MDAVFAAARWRFRFQAAFERAGYISMLGSIANAVKRDMVCD